MRGELLSMQVHPHALYRVRERRYKKQCDRRTPGIVAAFESLSGRIKRETACVMPGAYSAPFLCGDFCLEKKLLSSCVRILTGIYRYFQRALRAKSCSLSSSATQNCTALWSEIDLENALWTLPGCHYKEKTRTSAALQAQVSRTCNGRRACLSLAASQKLAAQAMSVS